RCWRCMGAQHIRNPPLQAKPLPALGGKPRRGRTCSADATMGRAVSEVTAARHRVGFIVVTRITVLGAGAWGTALARLLAAKGHRVTLWTWQDEHAAEMRRDSENRAFLPGAPFPPGLVVSSNLAEALA